MSEPLSELQLAAALCEQVYRRNSADQAIEDGDLGVTEVDEQAIDGLNYVDGFYYNDSTGFVGRIVQAAGKTFVVFRGSDLSGSMVEAGAAFLGDPVAPNLADSFDWSHNRKLGLGTMDATQLDDALALVRAAKAIAGNGEIVVTGQSLGGGLAGLVTAVENAREPLDPIKGYAIATAPFVNQLPIEASFLALEEAGYTKEDVRAWVPGTRVDLELGLVDVSVAEALRKGGAYLFAVIKANKPELSNTQIDDIVSERVGYLSAVNNEIQEHLEVHRIDGESLLWVPSFLHFPNTPEKSEAGQGLSLAFPIVTRSTGG